MPNGLLPPLRAGGRPPGRPGGAVGVPDGPGRFAAGEPGRGGTAPGPGLGRGAPPSAGGSRRTGASRCCCRAACAALTAASCSALRAAARASAAATSMSWALAGLATGVAGGCGGPGTGPFGRTGGAGRRGGMGLAEIRAGLLGLDGAGVGAAGAEGCSDDATNAPRSRRATGASTVLDADFTNSPISFSLARTVLLSTPSSFASSCTRALPATALLTPRSCGQIPQRPHSCT